jgi:ferric-dicitrate binding protein FerR (iron transport regulator)
MNFNLLSKHFAGETTPLEEQAVIEWQSESVLHQKEYKRLQVLWQKANDKHAFEPNFDTDKAWTKVNSQISKPQTKTTKIIPFWQWVAVASVLIAVLAFGAYQFKSTDESTTISVLAQNDKTITLEDGTVIKLHKGASITYPVHFATNQRDIQLTGEAFFDVAHDSNRPFVIDAGNTQVKVLGTSFNLRATNQLAEVVVKTGKVSFRLKDADKGLMLEAGKKGVFEKGKLQIKETTANDMAWQTGLLTFQETNLIEVVNALSHYYQIDIRLKLEDASEAANCTLNESYQNESLENVLKDLQKLLRIEYQKTPNGIVITSVNCGNR